GRYIADVATLDRLEAGNQVVLRYVGENPNGAMRDIAGIVSAEGNVMGLMPHPERALETAVGSSDGLGMFESMLARVAA
ncbi:MAG TPA: phosphoribosylformylglycinamidine synthase subunit PurQ, partial [Gemmatimonadaceae bacterium]